MAMEDVQVYFHLFEGYVKHLTIEERGKSVKMCNYYITLCDILIF